MGEEMCTLFDNDTWDFIPAAETVKKPIGRCWVFKIEHDADGMINQFKTQFIAKGYAQTHGIE